MNELVLILGMALVTFGVRYPVLAIVGKLTLPERVLKALRYVPPAVLSAIVIPAVIAPGDTLYLSYTNSYLIGAVVAVLVAWYSKNLLATIVIGMGVFLLWRTLIPA